MALSETGRGCIPCLFFLPSLRMQSLRCLLRSRRNEIFVLARKSEKNRRYETGSLQAEFIILLEVHGFGALMEAGCPKSSVLLLCESMAARTTTELAEGPSHWQGNTFFPLIGQVDPVAPPGQIKDHEGI